jgi:hypothetical protein
MKQLIVFLIYIFLGLFLIFSYKKINQKLDSQQLITPISKSGFSLENAPSKSLKATIISLSGDVGWQSRIATNSAAITKPMQIQQGEEIATGKNGQASIIFSNIANINIYPKTKINFIQTLPINILIEQNSGKSEYIKLSNNSLSIKSQSLLTKINQGKIIITVNESRPYISVDVKEGLATISYNDLNYITKVLGVKAKRRAIFQTDTRAITIIPLQ